MITKNVKLFQEKCVIRRLLDEATKVNDHMRKQSKNENNRCRKRRGIMKPQERHTIRLTRVSSSATKINQQLRRERIHECYKKRKNRGKDMLQQERFIVRRLFYDTTKVKMTSQNRNNV